MRIDPETEALWRSYLQAERDRVRGVFLPALERFLEGFLKEPEAERDSWAKELAAAVVDRGEEIPVRFPLFRRALLPVLAEGVLRGQPGCARWLSAFTATLYPVRDNPLPDHLQHEQGLLAEAIRVDPDDQDARRRLVDRLASYLEYTLHELPSGVLYGMDGATPEQCEELLETLDTFKGHAAIAGRDDHYADLIDACLLHYRAYADYLRSGLEDGSYEAYLRRRGLGDGAAPERPRG